MFVPLLIAVAAFQTGCGKTAKPVAGAKPRLASVSAAQSAASQPSVTFFGVKTEPAERVVYIINANGSMCPTWDFVRAEIRESVARLANSQSFDVILYRGAQPEVMMVGGKSGLTPATPSSLDAADKWLQSAVLKREVAQGLHDPDSAFRRAFEVLDGRSGVIYLLDCWLTLDRINNLLTKLNSAGEVKINSIAFLVPQEEGNKVMKDIAAQNGGQYRFVSEAELGR